MTILIIYPKLEYKFVCGEPGRKNLAQDDLTRFKVEFDRPEFVARWDRQPLSTMDLVFSVVVGFADQESTQRQTTA